MTSLTPHSLLYTPIHEWQTRLISLQPGTGEDDVQATLHVVDLIHAEGVQLHGTTQRVEYEALSYTWGDRTALQPVYINNTVVEVTENLHYALLTLRSENERRWLWIDAVCIHQADLEEKSQHLRRMFLIFRKAHRVVVFLGRAGQNTSHAFEHLRTPMAGRLPVTDVETSNSLQRVYDGLKDLWNRPWQWRIWVRQEVFAARGILVLCGDDQVNWDDFIDFPYSLSRLAGEMRERGYVADSLETRKFHTFQNLRRSEPDALSRILNDEYPDRRGSNTDIVQVLNDSIGCEMSDPLDQVYGILAMTKTMMASPGSAVTDNLAATDRSPRLVVDYSKRLASAFVDVAKYILNRDRTLHLLYLCDHIAATKDLSLPSWCPDWRHETPTIIAQLHDRVESWILENVKSKPSTHLNVQPPCRAAAHELVVEGVILGEIRDYSGPNFWPNCACNVIEKDAKITHSCLHVTASVPLYSFFEAHQKNVHVQLRSGVLTEIERRRLESFEQRFLLYFRLVHLACHCWKDRQGERITSDIPSATRTMLSNFWAVPRGAAQSDILVALAGGLVPVVLRPEHSGHFRYIGPATLCHGPYKNKASQSVPYGLIPYLYVLIWRLVELRPKNLQTFTLR